jgi:DNA-binding response OmpR family regulator
MGNSTAAIDPNSDGRSRAVWVRPDVRVVIVQVGEEVSDVIRERPVGWTLLRLTRSLLDDVHRIAPEVVIVDHSTSVDSARVCRDIRSMSPARIIALGDAPGDDDIAAIEVLRAGADYYLPRNTRMPALAARINATPLASASTSPNRGQRVGDVEIDDTGRVLRVAGDVVPCSRLRLALLNELARTPNVIVPTHSLLEALWGSNATPAHVGRLRIVVTRVRKLLGNGPGRPRIEAVEGIGYRLSIEPR